MLINETTIARYTAAIDYIEQRGLEDAFVAFEGATDEVIFSAFVENGLVHFEKLGDSNLPVTEFDNNDLVELTLWLIDKVEQLEDDEVLEADEEVNED
jgi:hypothetical protein